MRSAWERGSDAVVSAAQGARASAGVAGDAPFVCVLSAVEAGLGVPVVIAPLGPRLAGLYLPAGETGLVVIAGKDASTRRRFTLAHELGHHCLGHGTRTDTDETMLNESDPREVEANRFAAEFLVPHLALESLLERLPEQESELDLVCRVANSFSVSPSMARIRLSTCGFLTDPEQNARLDRRITRGEAATRFGRLELNDREDLCATPRSALPRIPDMVRGSQLEDLLVGRLSAQAFAEEHGFRTATVEQLLVS